MSIVIVKGSDFWIGESGLKRMASNIMRPAFAYTVVYVKDVAKSVEFYSRAFGHNVRRLDDSHRFVYICNSLILCKDIYANGSI